MRGRISFSEGDLARVLLPITCLSKGVKLRGYSQPSESFTSCLAWGRRSLVSHLINSLLTRALPPEDTGRHVCMVFGQPCPFSAGVQRGQSGMLVSRPACPDGTVRLWVDLSPNWVRTKRGERLGLHRAARWKQWLRPAMLKAARAKPEEMALSSNMGLI